MEVVTWSGTSVSTLVIQAARKPIMILLNAISQIGLAILSCTRTAVSSRSITASFYSKRFLFALAFMTLSTIAGAILVNTNNGLPLLSERCKERGSVFCKPWTKQAAAIDQSSIQNTIKLFRQTCPRFESLWSKANEDLPLSIVEVNHDTAAEGQYDPSLHAIAMGQQKEKEMRYWLGIQIVQASLFEIRNLLNFKLWDGLINRNQFPVEREKLAYLSAREALRLTNACLTKDPAYIAQANQLLEGNLSSFNNWWKHYTTADRIHAHQKEWDRDVKPFYCRKTPSAQECLALRRDL